ncbi:MAG: S-layer homology domain-containing protein [Oscillospiraceae bacterium]|nr:S-layer homology domain-containing protein [Oscillospiraceae bacterium]
MKKFLSAVMAAAMLAGSFNAAALAQRAEEESLLLPPEVVELSDGAALLYSDNVIEVQHNNTIDDIVAMERSLPHSGFLNKQTRYEEEPVLNAPYYAGSLNEDDLDDAMNALRMVRYLAGLPYENIILDEYETKTAQHKAVLMAVSEYGHHPPQPDDMSDDFFRTANSYSAECIFAGVSNISYSVLGFVADSGANNIAHAGHRMILLKPTAAKYGMGYAYNENAAWRHLIAIHVGGGSWAGTDSYVAWPNAGDFPIQYFITSSRVSGNAPSYPWSISLGEPYSYPSRADIELRLTRKRDNKTWLFNSDTPQQGDGIYSSQLMHLSVDSTYGNNIIFRPDVTSLGEIRDGDIFTVELSGIKYKNGTPATLSYEINFFDLQDALTKSKVDIVALHNGAPVEGAKVTIDDQTVITDSDGRASMRLKNNNDYSYTVEKDGFNIEEGSISLAEEPVTEFVDMTIPVIFTIEDAAAAYDAAEHSVKISASPDVSYTVTYNGSGDLPVDAGTYEVLVEANEKGYVGRETAKLTIAKADITVKANDTGKKIENADPELTYTITSGQLYGDDSFSGALSRQDGEEIGGYQILQGSLDPGPNYDMEFIPGMFIIAEKTPQNITVSELPREKTYGDDSFKIEVIPDEASGLTDFTFESSNESVASVDDIGNVIINGAGTVDITVKQAGDSEYAVFGLTQRMVVKKVEIVVTADDIAKRVDAADPELTYTYTGALVGDDAFTGSLERRPGEKVGKYDILKGTLALNDNYDMTYNKGVFEILEKLRQNITVSELPDEVTYGDDAFKIEVTPDEGSGLTDFTFESSNENVIAVDNGGNVTIKGVGTANITVKQAGNVDYAAFESTRRLTVNKVKIVVTADDKMKKIGTDDPELTYTYTGALVGEDKFTGSLERRSGEKIGKYDILKGTLALNDNYDMTYNKGIFEIVEKTPQNITVSEIGTDPTYGDESFALSVTADSESQLTDFTFESDNISVAEVDAEGTVTIKGAGEANITVKQAGNDDYAAFSKTQKLTVNKKGITIKSIDLDEKKIVFDGVLPGDEAITIDFDRLKLLSVSKADEENSEVTVSSFVLTGDGAQNYEVKDQSFESTIKTKNIVLVTVKASGGTVAGSGSYIKGSEITVTASPNKGYKFDGWYIDGKSVSSKESYSFTADGDVELTAKFKSTGGGGGGGGSSGGGSGGFVGGGTASTNRYTVSISYIDENGDVVGTDSVQAVYGAELTSKDLSVPHGYALDEELSYRVTKNDSLKLRVLQGEYLAEEPFVNGYEDGTFRPNNNITRSEIAAMIFNLMKADDQDYTYHIGRFADIPSTHLAGNAIGFNVANSYMNGDLNGNFRPDDSMTRAELAQILYNLGIASAGNSTANFPDINGHWAQKAVSAMAEAGVVNGYQDNTFRPDNSVTRAEAVTMIARLFHRSGSYINGKAFSDVQPDHWAYGVIMNAVNGN